MNGKWEPPASGKVTQSDFMFSPLRGRFNTRMSLVENGSLRKGEIICVTVATETTINAPGASRKNQDLRHCFISLERTVGPSVMGLASHGEAALAKLFSRRISHGDRIFGGLAQVLNKQT